MKHIPWRKAILIGLSSLLIIGLSFMAPGFTSPPAMHDFFQEASIGLLLSLGLSLVFLSGNIDFSLGGLYLLTLAFVRLWRKTDWALEGGIGLQTSAAITIGLIGLFMGALMGYLLSFRQKYSALFTIGFALIFACLGLSLMPDFGPWCGPWFCTEIYLPPNWILIFALIFGSLVSVAAMIYFWPEFDWIRPASLTWLMIGLLAFIVYEYNGLPLVVLVSILVLIALELFIKQNRWGLSIQAAGSHREAARLSGISLRSTDTLAFALMGLCVGIASLFEINTISVQEAGSVYVRQIDAFVAMLLGGVAYLGGSGSLSSVACAALFVAALNQLEHLGISALWLIGLKAFILLVILWIQPILEGFSKKLESD